MSRKNLLIRASAGTGKTYSLATRCLWLLLVQRVAPATIVALTFSRAAAQEIYAAILKRLWVAASHDDKAREEAHTLQAPSLTRDDFLQALRALINAQHAGNIATIDSFILKLVCNYPLELGFQNAVAVIDDFEKREGLKRASNHYLESEDRADNTDLQAFLTAFKACLKKAWPRAIRSALSAFMEGDLRSYVAGRDRKALPSKAEMLAALDLTAVQPFTVQPPATDAISFTCHPEDKKVCEAFDDFVARLRTFTGEEVFELSGSAAAKVAFWKLVCSRTDDCRLTYTCRNKECAVEIPREILAALRADKARADQLYLIEQVHKAAQQLEVLAAIEKNYDSDICRAGRLTFTDLAEFHKNFQPDQQLNIEYRFDSKFNHWALDEFQDTSCAQWGCLSSLVDNAAQDDEKSVMTVGDFKQAIYGWRGGSVEPFRQVSSWCAQGAEQWRAQDLSLSYRYQQNICDFINRIFNRAHLAAQDYLFVPTGETDTPQPAWLAEGFWQDHVAQTRTDSVKVVGVEPAASPEELAGLNPDASAVVKQLAKPILEEVEDCWKRRRKSHESLGVLVRSREDGLAIAAVLRQKGLPVVWEGKRGIRNTPLVELFLSPLVLAEHPEDTIAWQLLKRASFAEALPQEWTSAARVSALVGESLVQDGLARTLQKQLKYFPAQDELAAVVREAVKYENLGKGEGGIDAFKDYLDSIQNSDVSAGPDQIRIMTIHHSKGLTLDHVFVPLFETERSNLFKMCRPPQNTVLLSGDCRGKSWVLPAVSEKVSRCHAALKTAWQHKQNDFVSEILNLYYVALTRARRSLTVILPVGVQGVSSLIARAIETDARWQREKIYEVCATEEPKAKTDNQSRVQVQGFAPTAGYHKIDYKRVSPSLTEHTGAASHPKERSNLFAEAFDASRKKGLEVHARYEAIEYLDSADAGTELQKALVRRGDEIDLWREKAYELVRNETWETGCIDRVVFYRDGSAIISDYKTNAKWQDESDDDFKQRLAKTYAPQLKAYQEAVHRLTGIPNEKIKTQLLATAIQGVIDVRFAQGG